MSPTPAPSHGSRQLEIGYLRAGCRLLAGDGPDNDRSSLIDELSARRAMMAKMAQPRLVRAVTAKEAEPQDNDG